MASTLIPDDFPRSGPMGAVPGVQPKLLVREEAGQFMLSKPTDSEVQARYELCEDLVQQLIRYTTRKRDERPDWTRAQVREKVAASVRQKAFGWGLSANEAEWIVQRLAAMDGSTPAAGGRPTS